MSRRLRKFRPFQSTSMELTYAKILGSFQVARDENGAVITRPIRAEKAQRLATALHRASTKLR